MLQSPQPPPIETILTELLNAIALMPHEFILVLDDYHLITNPAIHRALTFLLDHLPPQMHLVIASRAEPPLPLPLLRVRRELVEISAADLRFTPDEAAAFLNRVMKLNLSAASRSERSLSLRPRITSPAGAMSTNTGAAALMRPAASVWAASNLCLMSVSYPQGRFSIKSMPVSAPASISAPDVLPISNRRRACVMMSSRS